MSDDILEFTTLVGHRVLEWGYIFDVDELGLMVFGPGDGAPLALLHHAGDGLIEVVYFQDGNTAIPPLPKPVKKRVFMGDQEWEAKVKELIETTKRAYAEGADGHTKRE